MIGAFLRRRYQAAFDHERLELDDGDFLDLRWLRQGHDRLVILSHGLEGNAEQGYVRGMAAAANAAGRDPDGASADRENLRRRVRDVRDQTQPGRCAVGGNAPIIVCTCPCFEEAKGA